MPASHERLQDETVGSLPWRRRKEVRLQWSWFAGWKATSSRMNIVKSQAHDPGNLTTREGDYKGPKVYVTLTRNGVTGRCPQMSLTHFTSWGQGSFIKLPSFPTPAMNPGDQGHFHFWLAGYKFGASTVSLKFTDLLEGLRELGKALYDYSFITAGRRTFTRDEFQLWCSWSEKRRGGTRIYSKEHMSFLLMSEHFNFLYCL